MVLIELEYLIESKSRMKDLEFLKVLFFEFSQWNLDFLKIRVI